MGDDESAARDEQERLRELFVDTTGQTVVTGSQDRHTQKKVDATPD